MKLRRHDKQPSEAVTPFSQINRVREELNRFFEDPLSVMRPGKSFFQGWEPSVDVYENEDQITVRAELPGMKREEISVSLDEDTLNISGERKREQESKEGETYRSERYFGRFQRSVTLSHPVDAEKIQANYKDGVLTIRLPKAEAGKRRHIEVKSE